LCALAPLASAHAATVYALSGTFLDGTAFGGTFTYDPTLGPSGTFTAWDITTVEGTVVNNNGQIDKTIKPFEFISGAPGSTVIASGGAALAIGSSTVAPFWQLSLQFDTAASFTATTVQLCNGTLTPHCGGAGTQGQEIYQTQIDGRYQRLVASGAAIAVVPLPAGAWLLGSSLLGLPGIARRRRVLISARY
jgi:hypothetical protein